MDASLTQLLKIRYPIIQAPIGSATTPELAAAVSNAGGLGTLALSWKGVSGARSLIQQTKKLTTKPFAVNLVLKVNQVERVQGCIEEKVPVVLFSWGDCTPFIRMLKQNGIIVAQTVGSSNEALEFLQKGIDFIIAQGWEAGGHILGEVAISVLIPAIANKVNVPVVAAGGIADGRGVLAVLSLGAAGACLGTCFLMSKEAYINPLYQKLIEKACETDTLYCKRLFNKGWDHTPHRVIKNSTTTAREKAGKPEVGSRPNENEIIAYKQNGEPIERYRDVSPIASTTGNLEALALYAGQSAGLISTVKTAEAIVQDLINEVKQEAKRLLAIVES